MNKNFKLIKKQKIKHPNAEFSLLEHKSGAKVYLFKNKDKHRFFAIDFVTLPFSEKGEPHILEHSLLYGSKKYPSQDADIFSFLFRRRQMLQMNASTYPDKTNYYFSSINKEDFLYAMDVYLDGVFNPELLENKNIFRNEAWRVEEQGGSLRFSGVVLNEMLSSFVSPARIFELGILKGMLQDSNAYKYESGGDPNYITDLKYEELIDFYKTFYGTKNAKIFLYGDVGKKELELLDSFLSNHFKGKKYKIKAKKNATLARKTFKAPAQDGSGKFALAFYAEPQEKVKENLKISILLNSLSSFESDFLKKELKALGLSKNVYFEFESYTPINLAIIYFEGVEPKNFKKLEKDALKVLQEGAKNISKERIMDSINSLLYTLERSNLSAEKGEALYDSLHSLWHYDEELENIDFISLLKEIKSEFEKDDKLFERLYKKYFAKAKNYGVFILKPQKDLNLLSRFEKKQKALLSLKGKKLEKIKKEIEEFKAFKERDINDNVISATPTNALSEKVSLRSVEKKTKSGFKVYFSKSSSSIVSVDLLFDISHLSIEELQRLNILLKAFKFFSSKSLSLQEIDKLKSKYAKVFSFNIKILKDKKGKLTPYLHFKGESFSKDLPELLRLFNIKMHDLVPSKELIEKALKEELNSKKEALSHWYSHRSIAINYALSFKDEFYLAQDYLSGLRFYEFLKKESEGFDLELYEELYKKISYSSQKLLALSAKGDYSEDIIKTVKIGKTQAQDFKLELPREKKNIFFTNKLLGGAQNILVFKVSEKFFAASSVLKSALSYGFLFKEIREKGGAYGAAFSADRFGNAYFASWSDSNVKRTYRKFIESLEEFDVSDTDLQGAKARALLAYDAPEHELSLAAAELLEDLAGISLAQKEKEKRQILSFDKTALQRVAKELLDALNSSAQKFSFAPKKQDEKLFDEFREIEL